MKSFVPNRTPQRKLQTLKRKEVNGGKERNIIKWNLNGTGFYSIFEDGILQGYSKNLMKLNREIQVATW